MSRFTPLDGMTLDAAQQRVADEVSAGRRGTVPANVVAWLPSPELARRAAHLGEFVRYETALAPRLSELAILVVARHWSCAYEWAVHAVEAAGAGVPADVIDAVANGIAPGLAAPDEAVFEFARELVRRGSVSDEAFQAVDGALGRQAVVELTALVGYYTLVAMTLNAFEVPAPTGAPRLPDVIA
jgi:4-carboxymuconolactone decarboxylase